MTKRVKQKMGGQADLRIDVSPRSRPFAFEKEILPLLTFSDESHTGHQGPWKTGFRHLARDH